MDELEPMRRRGNVQSDTATLEVSDDFMVGFSLVPRHDNHACTLCLASCLLMWFISACGLSIAFGVLYPRAHCGVACRADRSTPHFSCAWLFSDPCYNGLDDGKCAGCSPRNSSLLETLSFEACCPMHLS